MTCQDMGSCAGRHYPHVPGLDGVVPTVGQGMAGKWQAAMI